MLRAICIALGATEERIGVFGGEIKAEMEKKGVKLKEEESRNVELDTFCQGNTRASP